MYKALKYKNTILSILYIIYILNNYKELISILGLLYKKELTKINYKIKYKPNKLNLVNSLL